jgi:hypothetical protein
VRQNARSGPQSFALPAGQNTPAVGQCAATKIFHFTEIRKVRKCRVTRPKEEGRIAIVTNAGRAAVDASHIGAKSFAGRVTVSEDLAPTTGAVRVRQNRVVLAPGVCAPSLVVMWLPDRAMRISHPQGDGGNSASLPGESTT